MPLEAGRGVGVQYTALSPFSISYLRILTVKLARLGVAHHLLDSHLGGEGTIPGLKTEDLVYALWVGRDYHLLCQLSAIHPSTRRESWKSIISVQQGGAWLPDGGRSY